ncbi:double-strand break repair protein AddB [Curvivirga aplysinae]|uniref:double-strand break repair protein AddB n=1 Tax=Curvivirga aplysinae TaxID=2529852 RepID=UPI0012BCBCE5|nr:double-strand break repair protein AddB [Curvivirga aplysinae]MTI11118.1 double-strand break repair protein AddB [Curvivirga aplysinae]
MTIEQADLFTAFDEAPQPIHPVPVVAGEVSVYTIAPNITFVDALAAKLLKDIEEDPLAISDMVILLPTRRACRALRDAFLRLGKGKPILLPVMRPIGDVDEDELLLGAEGHTDLGLMEEIELPPAISNLHRQLLLTSLIRMRPIGDHTPSVEQAARLAQELARLLDQVQTEQLTLDGLENLIEGSHEFSDHWREIIEFLDILRKFWPAILEENGALDPADRRNRILNAQAMAWEASPPTQRILAAGMTGSIPAAANLLRVIAHLPEGQVILPGVDLSLSDEDWAAVEEDETHPQYGFAHVLKDMGITREDVKPWTFNGIEDHQASDISRVELMTETLRSARTTDKWRGLSDWPEKALDGICQIDCPTSGTEAATIALLMRARLQEPEQTVALVSPDRMLARRVASELQRWGIQVDDSAGQPLSTTAPATYMRLLADAVSLSLSPVSLLSLLKHPMSACGDHIAQFRRDVRLLETECLRGPKPAPGMKGLRALVEDYAKADHRKPEKRDENVTRLTAFLDRLEAALKPLLEVIDQETVDLPVILEAHMEAAEALAASYEESGSDRLWAGDAGETLANFLADLGEDASLVKAMPPREYPSLFESLLVGQAVRAAHGRHPRAFIWGPMEARLQHTDLVILGGLNEGIWPPESQSDPWMSRPMRQKFGLPLPERRIGLSAHDFAQCFCAGEVVITRAEKTDGSPTVPSRWLSRLDVVLDKLEMTQLMKADRPWLDWAIELGQAEGETINPPAPTPPIDARPNKLSVTRIEAWMRNPYGIYAEKILGLRPLDPLEQEPGAADRGNFIHAALEDFMEAFPYNQNLPETALDKLLEFGEKHFQQHMAHPAVRAFWWPRFERIAAWFVEKEKDRRKVMLNSLSEIQGAWTFNSPAGEFILTAKADRLDKTRDQSALSIVDYKTGSPPSSKMVAAGYAPQLPLEAVIAAKAGFKEIPNGEDLDVAELSFWKLSGGDPAGKEHPVRIKDKSLAELVEEAEEGVQKLVHKFADEKTPYLATPKMRYASRYNDFEHLAREGEWRIAEEGED